MDKSENNKQVNEEKIELIISEDVKSNIDPKKLEIIENNLETNKKNAKKKKDEEAAAKKKAKKAKEAASRKKKTEEDDKKKIQEAISEKKAEEEIEDKKLLEEEASAKKKAEEEADAKKKVHDEAIAKKKAEEADAKKKVHDEAIAKKKAEEEADAKKKVHDEAIAKKKAEEEAAAKKKAQDEALAKKKAEEEAAIRKAAEKDILMTAKFSDVDSWYNLFSQHSNQTKLTINNKSYHPKQSRNEFVDESKTEVWLNVSDNQRVAVTCCGVDMISLGNFMNNDPAMKQMTNDFKWDISPPNIINDFNIENTNTANILCSLKVDNFEKWHNGFKKHSYSRTLFKPNTSLPYTRSQICNDKRTLVFRKKNDANRILIVLYEVDLLKLNKLVSHKNMKSIGKLLGEVNNSKIIKQFI